MLPMWEYTEAARRPQISTNSREVASRSRSFTLPRSARLVAGLLTGRSQVRYGVLNVISPFTRFGLPTDEHILPQTFKAAGYQTAMMGKWHLGHWHDKYFPHNRGFDHFYGHLNGYVDYFTHEREGGIDWQRNGKTVVEEGYTTDLLAAEAIRWIKGRDKSRPFLLYLPFNAPHVPLQAPKALIDKYAGIGDAKKRTYAAMVDALDSAVGRVLGSLDQEGIRENTLVLFFSDNGGPIDEGASNTPLRAGKGNAYEGGIRSIAVFDWRGKLHGGRKLAQSMSVLDVFPTLCAATGVTPRNTKPFDGENMWPVITSGKTRPHSPMYFAIDHYQWGFSAPSCDSRALEAGYYENDQR
jgi:arylsulfatase B